MPAVDLDRARSRFIQAVKRFIAGARLEKDRLNDMTAAAPRLLKGTQHEIVNLSGLPDNDLDYYIYELGRLQDAARAIIKIFGSPPEVVDSLATFDAAVPNLRAARNPLTHASNDPRLDNVAWFSALVRFRSNGSVDYLVDPRSQHHDAAEDLAAALLSYLRAGLRTT